jgi:hypothetical protein
MVISTMARTARIWPHRMRVADIALEVQALP